MRDDPPSEPVEIGPLTDELLVSFHHTLDVVAMERRYLTLLRAPSADETRKFVAEGVKRGDVRVVAVAAGTVSSAGAIYVGLAVRRTPTGALSALVSCPPSANAAWASA